MKRLLRLCVFSLLLGGGLAAQDFPAPAKLSLDQAWRLADERSPALVAAREAVARAEAGVAIAAVRPNPSFSVESQGYSFSNPAGSSFLNQQELTLRAEQEIELGGRRSLRTGVAQAGVEMARADLANRRRQLLLDVRRAYLSTALAQADLDAAALTLGEIDTLIAINRTRLEQGEISGVEMRRLQVERFRFADDRFAAELANKNARAGLLALLNVTPLDQTFELADGLGTATAMPAEASAASSLQSAALADRPDVQAARQGQLAAKQELSLQNALRTPNITVGAGYKRDFGAGGLVIDLSVPLPFFDRNQGGIARAAADQRLANAAEHAVELAVALDVNQAKNAAAVSQSRLNYIEREYLKNARETRDIVLASYRAGASTLTDYLDAQRALREAQRVQNRALFDYQLSLFQLEAAIGRMPLSSSPTPRKELP